MKAKKMLFGLILASYALSFAHSTLAAPAAPFCAVFSYGRHCWYYTYQECFRAVSGTEGYCAVSSAAIRQPSNVAPFCVVNPYATQCWYYDMELCRGDAAASGGVCLSSIRVVGTPAEGNVGTPAEGNAGIPAQGNVGAPVQGTGPSPMVPGVTIPLPGR